MDNLCRAGRHAWSDSLPYSGRQYCRACGEPKASTAVDWEQPLAPGPVRMVTREELMQDARRGQWHPITNAHELPEDRTIIVGVAPPSTPNMWYMKRKAPGTNHIIWCSHTGLAATHWAEDTLGTP